MVKKKLGGSKKRKPVKPAADSTAAATDQDGDGPEPPSHVKKRLTKKLHFLERVADSKRQALSATAGIRKKAHKSKHKQQKPLPDLSSLADLLAEVGQKQHQQAAEAGQGADGQPNKQKGRTEQINGSKARRAVTQVETTRMQQVLAHPDFQANPLAAIRNHLAATLPEPAPVKPQSNHKQQPRRPKQRKPKSEAAMMQS
ncbi:TPA: hypothetical protein ACH3X2_001097 [Trebouxia sp. C0005]